MKISNNSIDLLKDTVSLSYNYKQNKITFNKVFLGALMSDNYYTFLDTMYFQSLGELSIADQSLYASYSQSDHSFDPSPNPDFNIDKLLEITTYILDKYSDNQEENWNIKFVLWAREVCLTSLKEDSLSYLLNPNFLDYFDLIGILPKFFREEYLEYYKNKKYNLIEQLLNRLISIWHTKIETLNYGLINNSKNLYLLILDISVLKLEAEQITLSDFYLLLSNNPLSHHVIKQSKGLDSFLLNIELDGIDQGGGIEFDSNRWDFIYHWIEQMRDFVVSKSNNLYNH